MKSILTLFSLLLIIYSSSAQINASLMQHPDVSEDKICFVYGEDIWVAEKNGGMANKLSSPSGREYYPRFSPDGKTIAYTANYHGNSDIYIIPTNGGVPKRLTFHGMSDAVTGWTPDGKSVIFASSRESGRQRFRQFFKVSINGGQADKLPVPYGEYASMSADGSKIAFTDLSRVNRNWKRYRGGTAPDIHIFDLNTYETTNITNNTANDELPMWVESTIYYMSDNGPDKRNNIWKYDISSKTNKQVTNFKDFDITFPEAGPKDIIFEAGGRLYLFDLATENSKEVKIQVISDQIALIPKQQKVSSYMQDYSLSADGSRVIVQARGELFNLPAEEGYISNLSNSSGTAERNPSWSPDGKSLAYWSDKSGEYQLLIMDMSNDFKTRTLTNFTQGFNYNLYWSPDNSKIAYVNQAMELNFIDVKTGKVTTFDKGKYLLEGGLRNFVFDWSPDSRWLTYSKSSGNRSTSAIFLYDTKENKVSQLTSGFYSDSSPRFSQDGKYLFYSTNRTFQPLYSDLDNTWIYPNTTGIAVGTLKKGTKSLIDISNDEVEIMSEDEDDESTKKKDKESKNERPETFIDIQNFENRVEMLDIEPGNLGNISALDDKIIFMRYPNSGSSKDTKASLDFYDFKDQKVKTIIEDVNDYQLSANGEKILINKKRTLAVIKPSEGQKMDKTVPTSKMMMSIVPKEEWKQIFNEVWRIERDYFYDPNMHGVDWMAMKERYGALVEDASSREDVNIILGDLIAELNASHTYVGGGDVDNPDRLNVGYLGADFTIENGYFRIKKIINGAQWDVEERSPLSKPGTDVNEGDYILEINGQKPDINKPISASLQGQANETIQLKVSSSPNSEKAKKVIVKTMDSETRLRHLEWIENNRKRVEEATNGRVGYIYVRSTGLDGQNELVRQFYAQMDKEAMIIDERFNSGGQIPDRFIELLDRKPLAFWAVRDGEDWSWPPSGNFGPKVMLINGFSGSGGDAFPDYFKKRELGPLIGTRTWGGLIGISGAPTLIDNGYITSPTFRMYDPDGEWFREGHGVEPDIKVVEDFQKLANGTDAQLEAGITEVMRLLESKDNFKKPERPAYEKR